MASLALLSRLWLHEPDDQTLAEARQIESLGPCCADPAELAIAYADLLLLNVYPYASVFLDPDGELNGPRAREMEALYRRHGFAPKELDEVGASDHVGLMLGFADAVGPDAVLPYLLDWVPVFCLAVEREPAVHPFYRALAVLTRETLFARCQGQPSLPAASDSMASLSMIDAEVEVSMRAIVHWLLSPAQSGLFLSRSRFGTWARDLGLPVPFGERFQVSLSLFESAGIAGQVERVLDWLEAEVMAWEETYHAWALAAPSWAPYANGWRARTSNAIRMLKDMRLLLRIESVA